MPAQTNPVRPLPAIARLAVELFGYALWIVPLSALIAWRGF